MDTISRFFIKLILIPKSLAQEIGSPGSDLEAGQVGDNSIKFPNPVGVSTFNELLDKIINYVTLIAVPILSIMVLWGGFQMLTAKDNPANFDKGRKTITYAAIGFAVILVAQGLEFVIREFFAK